MSKRKRRKKIYSPSVWHTWLVVAFGWLLSRLSVRAVSRIGVLTGNLVHRLARQRRHFTEVNLDLCFPELTAGERTSLVKQTMVHTSIGALEVVLPWLNPTRDLSGRMTITGVHHLEAAIAEGRGVVLIGGHFSAMDIISQGLAQAVDIDVMYRENKNPVWEWLQVSGRSRYFDGVIERGDTRQTLRRLKAGRAIWYAADQDYGPKHSVFAPFFGVSTATITATARLARFNNSPVIFMKNFRDLDTLTWSIDFSPRVVGFPSGDDIADATRINGIIEAAIREHPEQYLWMHRRFKTRPPGEPSVY
jgi:KDO2-lipid IV(A) lauroyltransferase